MSFIGHSAELKHQDMSTVPDIYVEVHLRANPLRCYGCGNKTFILVRGGILECAGCPVKLMYDDLYTRYAGSTYLVSKKAA